jgi:hypothetical protein
MFTIAAAQRAAICRRQLQSWVEVPWSAHDQTQRTTPDWSCPQHCSRSVIHNEAFPTRPTCYQRTGANPSSACTCCGTKGSNACCKQLLSWLKMPRLESRRDTSTPNRSRPQHPAAQLVIKEATLTPKPPPHLLLAILADIGQPCRLCIMHAGSFYLG